MFSSWEAIQEVSNHQSQHSPLNWMLKGNWDPEVWHGTSKMMSKEPDFFFTSNWVPKTLPQSPASVVVAFQVAIYRKPDFRNFVGETRKPSGSFHQEAFRNTPWVIYLGLLPSIQDPLWITLGLGDPKVSILDAFEWKIMDTPPRKIRGIHVESCMATVKHHKTQSMVGLVAYNHPIGRFFTT